MIFQRIGQYERNDQGGHLYARQSYLARPYIINALFIKFDKQDISNIYFEKLHISSLKKIINTFSFNLKDSLYNIVSELQEGLITKLNIQNLSNISKIKFSVKFSELDLNILNKGL